MSNSLIIQPEKPKLVSTSKAQLTLSKMVQTDFDYFVEKSFNTLNPGTKYIHGDHIALMYDKLKKCETGEIKRLIINIAPRFMKSTAVVQAWPAWLLAKDPSRRIYHASYVIDLALRNNMAIRDIITSDWYKRAFPHVIPKGDQNDKRKFMTSMRGQSIATSVGGGRTGEGGNYMIIDDPIQPDKAKSKTARETCIEWYRTNFKRRLDGKGCIILVMQRVHVGDLSGWLQKLTGQKWEVLNLDAEEEPCLSYWVERYGEEIIAETKEELRNADYQAQYRQKPIPEEGAIMNINLFGRYANPPAPFVVNRVIQSWDTASKAGELNDYSVCTTWAETDKGHFLIDLVRKKMEYPKLKKEAIKQFEKHRPSKVIIEDKGSGISLIQDLKNHKGDYRIPAVGIIPKGDKELRADAAMGLVEAGHVFLPKKADWLVDLEVEMAEFPDGDHDDQIDSISQYLNYVNTKKKITPGSS